MAEVPNHVRFLRRCHRRWVVWRFLECAGIGAALGSALGFFILPILFWRAESTIAPACMVLSIGAVAGALFGLTRRPTLLQTALEADRQLKLNDLLSTTVMSRAGSGDDGFAALVQRQAEEICRRLSPNELIVRRLGGRAWGGIGIASSLLMTLAMMTTQPASTQAKVNGLAVNERAVKIPVQSIENPSARTNLAARQSSLPADPSDRPPVDNSLNERDSDFSPRTRNATPSRASANKEAAGDGTGSTSGQTNDASVPRLAQSTDLATNDENGKPSKGDGNAVFAGAGDPSALATGGKVSYQATSATPWQSATWNADRAHAMQNVQSGKTPDAYRALIREYFDVQR